MTFMLPPLPYKYNALEPYISEETLNFHHKKHHNTYVQNLNILLSKSSINKNNIEDIIKSTSGTIFNNAAQVFNHTFYWYSMSPKGGGFPKGKIKDAINKSFGNFNIFKLKFTQVALNKFGSGWIWLIKNKSNHLIIETTTNAECPITKNKKIILTCDLWEHAYYIDYKNDRKKYIENWWNLINWNFANQNIL